MVYSDLASFSNHQSPKKMEQEKKIKRQIANSNERRRMQSINAGFNSLRTMLPKYDNEKLSKAAILQHTAEYIDQLESEKTRLLQEIRDIKKLLNPELLEQHQKSQEQETKLMNKQPFKRIKLEFSNSLDQSNSESSDEGIQLGNSSPKQENKKQLINQQMNDKQQEQNNSNDYKSTSHSVGSTTTINKNGCAQNLIAQNVYVQQQQLTNGKSYDVIDSDDIDVVRAEYVQVRNILDKERRLRMTLEEQVREYEAQLYPTRIKEIAQQVQMQYQNAGVNVYQAHQIIQQQSIKDQESEIAVSSIINEPQHEIIAQTVEIGAEIEAQDCTDYQSINNQQTVLSSSHSNFDNHLLTLSNKSASNVNIPTTATFHIIHDIANQTLIDSTNLINSIPDNHELIEMGGEVSNKILTSTAYLTAINNTPISTSKPTTKCKNSTNKSDKNVNSKSKSSNNASNQQQLITENNKISSTNNKKSSSITVTALPFQSSTHSNQSEIKKDKQKKSKHTQPAAIALPLDVPYIFDSSSTNNLETNKLNQSQSLPNTTTVTVQIIDSSNLTSSTIDKFDVQQLNSTMTTSGRNSNLDTILEAICHLEGNMFANDDKDSGQNKNELKNKQMKANLTLNSDLSVIVTSSDT